MGGIHIFTSANGHFNIISSEHMKEMTNKAIVGNIGHFDNEIDMAGLEGFEGIKVENITPPVEDIKLDVHADSTNRVVVAELLRNRTSKSGDMTISFKEYVDHMREGQKAAVVQGVYGETTTGVHQSKEMADKGEVLFFIIKVTDWVSNSKFDNVYGRRHSLPTAHCPATCMAAGNTDEHRMQERALKGELLSHPSV